MIPQQRIADDFTGWTVAILAGGLGTRLGPLTQACPKAMIEVAGEPFIAHQLRQLAAQGLQRVVLCLGHLAEHIVQFVGDGSRYGIQVGYSLEGVPLHGTGGALRKALPQLGDRFFVLYGDSYLPIPFEPVAQTFQATHTSALMTVLRNAGRWDRSNAALLGNRVLYNKRSPGPEMTYIDYGLGILTPGVFAGWPENQPFDLADLYQKLSELGELAGFEVSVRFFEIGSPRGLTETEQYFQAERARNAAAPVRRRFPD